MTAGELPTVAKSSVVPQAVRSSAACVGVDGDVFFPPPGDARPGHPDHDWSPYRAIAICRLCPALDQCRDYAMGIRGLSGVWGGTTEAERTHTQEVMRSLAQRAAAEGTTEAERTHAQEVS